MAASRSPTGPCANLCLKPRDRPRSDPCQGRMQIIRQYGWLSGTFEAHVLISFSSLRQRMSPDRSRGKEKAAELLWMLRYSSSTNSYYEVISEQRAGPRPPSLGRIAHQSEAEAAWVTLHRWDSSVTWQIECDSDHLFSHQTRRGGNRNQMGMNGEKFPHFDFSGPLQ